MKVYCINLERRPDRRKKVEDEFRREGMNSVEFFKATDGCSHPRMNKGECGCTDSHIRVWRDIVANNYEWALVFEDDARLVENFSEKLDEIVALLPEGWDYVNLGRVPGHFIRDRHFSHNLFSKGSSTTTHAYLISQKGARQISLWNTLDVQFIVDMQIARTPLNMYFTEAPLATQNIAGQPLLGFFKSMFDGDLGIIRKSFDMDFGFRTQWPTYIYFLLVLSVCYAMQRS